MKLGTCYYPEHWPESGWADDARRMADMGLSRIRVGEFAWSRIEPEPGTFEWGWLDRAVSTLTDAGLEIILGTPTATPPKWLVDQMPDVLPMDAHGNVRGFGSRKHFDFSHQGYRAECARIVTAMAERYGAHAAVTGWQTDNEYGCHDTTLSYSVSAHDGFRRWLAAKYDDVAALNAAWGNVFWSMEYRSFDEIELPNLTVTEPNPAHVLDFRRFASDQVVAYNAVQVDILRRLSPGREIIHNFMGFYTAFDHHDVGADLDVASWDSYPLGFLEMFPFPADVKLRYARQGHPDVAAFHHDLYRGCSQKWSVMEQQPGPVNWAANNPAPLPGMVTLWTLEAMAHGADLVSYFRWRQVPFAQEQMHAGLLRPDSEEAPAASEARAAADVIARVSDGETVRGDVALIFSYEADWLFRTQPQGNAFAYQGLAFQFYSALRQLGLDVDIVGPQADLSGYPMVVAPSLPIVREDLLDRLADLDVPLLLGPRSGSKTEHFSIPDNLAPGVLQELIDVKVTLVESLRGGLVDQIAGYDVAHWREHVDSLLAPEIGDETGGLVWKQDKVRYVSAWPSAPLLDRLFRQMALEAGVQVVELPEDIRLRRLGKYRFAFNYGPGVQSLPQEFGGPFIVGDRTLPPAGVAVWEG